MPRPASEPLLTFGIVSDPHIGDKAEAPTFLENALRRLAEAGVDAVVCPGDIAHSGLISEMEMFADIWNRVFPDWRGPDGRKVELLLVTGNHDIDAWGGRCSCMKCNAACPRKRSRADCISASGLAQ